MPKWNCFQYTMASRNFGGNTKKIFVYMNWFSFFKLISFFFLLLQLFSAPSHIFECVFTQFLDGLMKMSSQSIRSIVLTQGYCTDTQFLLSFEHCINVFWYLTANIYIFCAVNRRSDFWLNLKLTLRFERNVSNMWIPQCEHTLCFFSSLLFCQLPSSTVADWLDIFKPYVAYGWCCGLTHFQN